MFLGVSDTTGQVAGQLWLRHTFKQKARTKGAGFHLVAALVTTLAQPHQVTGRQVWESGLGSLLAPGWVCEAGRLVLEERDNLHAVCIAVITSFCSPSVFMETLCGDAANLSSAERKR